MLNPILQLVSERKSKPKLTGAALRESIIANSHCEVYREGNDLTKPEFLQIEFHGLAARIPSLKNSKMPGHNFINNSVLAHLLAMDRLYFSALGNDPIYYGSMPVFCVVILGKRPQTFDVDNGLAAVKDWLEPRKVKGGRTVRRWGVGIVADDRYVTGFAIHSQKIVETDYTTIIIRPWGVVNEHVTTMIAKVVTG